MRRALVRVPLAAALLVSGGCVVTVENDSRALGGNDDRWYTSGVRLQRDLAAPDPGMPEDGAGTAAANAEPGAPGASGSGLCWLDQGTAAVGSHLDLLPEDSSRPWPGFTTLSLVAGQQAYSPENLDAKGVVEDDRPYAGWLYAGVVRFDTQLDPDEFARRDVERVVELDLGVVGPASYAGKLQEELHQVIGAADPEGWSNQLGNEIGIVLRGRRSSRDAYVDGLLGGDVAFDAITALEGAVGNVDTHAGLAETVRLGFNLPRSFDEQSGDRRRLLPGGARRPDEPASLHVFGGFDVRFVLHNIFLDGNTFRESHSIDKEEVVGALRAGLAWESGGFRVAYTWTALSEEFEGQPEHQTYGAVTLGWGTSF